MVQGYEEASYCKGEEMITRDRKERIHLKCIFIQANPKLAEVAFALTPKDFIDQIRIKNARKNLVYKARIKLAYSDTTASCDILIGLRKAYNSLKGGSND
jgi:hypothetical protein